MVVGSIIPFAGSTIPEGFLVCNGAAVSRDIYADLFSVIGTTFGAGDGLNTFNLPNLVGRVAMCDSVNYTLGASGGEETHTLTSTELASHSHAVPPPDPSLLSIGSLVQNHSSHGWQVISWKHPTRFGGSDSNFFIFLLTVSYISRLAAETIKGYHHEAYERHDERQMDY